MAGRSGAGSRAVVGRWVLVAAFVSLALLPASQGCSGPSTSLAPSTGNSTSLESVPATVRPADTVQLFVDLAAEVAPQAVYAPAYLPDGAALASSWAPVIESSDPGSSGAPPRRNPYVVGSGSDAEAQIVYKVGEGWLVFIHNFHGDLGDVSGEYVGTVGGRPASLYALNGGLLVQWSNNGCWYGVFGRGLSRDVILAAALGMKVMR